MKGAWKKSMHENSVLMLNSRFAIKLFDLENKVESIAKSVPLPVFIVPPVWHGGTESFEKQLIFLISRRMSNFSKMSTEISEKFTREWSAEA